MDLGDQISISGLEDLDTNQLIVIKKIVGNYVKRFGERHPDFQRLVLHHKQVHATHHEFQGSLHWGSASAHAAVTDSNVFFAVDNCLKKLDVQARA